MNKDNILRYLKIKGAPDSITDALINSCMEEAVKVCTPKRLFKICNVKTAEDGVYLDEVFFEGEKMIKRLRDCEKCAVMAVTLGTESDFLLRKYSITDPARTVVMQSVLADYTEDFCDITEDEIKANNPGFELKLRFSPGYPGFPLEFQKKIFYMLDITKRIGISLTDSCLMIPTKSVSAFAGLKKVTHND